MACLEPLYRSPFTPEPLNNPIVECIIKNIIEKWPATSKSSYTHTIVLIGGFQGSGKSTLAQSLMKKAKFSVMSTDEIRFSLTNKNQITAENVNSIGQFLLKKACDEGRALVVDANGHPTRIAEIMNLLHDYPNYRVVKILLKGSETTLTERIAKRCPKIDAYNGTITDLHASMNRHRLEPSDYDRVFDIENSSPDDVSEEVLQTLARKIKPARFD